MVLSLSEVVCALIKVFPVHYRLCHFDAVFSYTYLLTYLLMRLPLLVPLIIFKFLCLLHSSNIFAIFIILLLYSRSLLYFAIVLLLSTMFFQLPLTYINPSSQLSSCSSLLCLPAYLIHQFDLQHICRRTKRWENVLWRFVARLKQHFYYANTGIKCYTNTSRFQLNNCANAHTYAGGSLCSSMPRSFDGFTLFAPPAAFLSLTFYLRVYYNEYQNDYGCTQEVLNFKMF